MPRKRDCSLTVEEKLRIVEEAETGTIRGTAREHGIHPAQIRQWKRNLPRLEETFRRNPKAKTISAGRPLQAPDLEAQVSLWIHELQRQGTDVSSRDIITKALTIDPSFKGGQINVLRSWVYPFMRRCQLNTTATVSSIYQSDSEDQRFDEDNHDENQVDSVDVDDQKEVGDQDDDDHADDDSTAGQNSVDRTPVGDVKWRDGLEKVYTNNNGSLSRFRPAPTAVSESALDDLHAAIERILRTSRIRIFDVADEAERALMIDEVMRTVVDECDQQHGAQFRRNYLFKSERLNSLGRTDRLVARRGCKVLVVQSNDFDKGLARMVVGTESMLVEQFNENPDSYEPVYGVVSNFLSWIFMELTTNESRFYEVYIVPGSTKEGLRKVSEALLSFLRELPTEKMDELATR